MTLSELTTVAEALRTALAYESREVRIARLKEHPNLAVRALALSLERHGVLKEIGITALPTLRN